MPRLIAPLLLLSLLIIGGVGSMAQDTPATPAAPPPRPAPSAVLTGNTVGAELYFTTLEQGTVGLIRLTGPTISEARALFMSREYQFVNIPGDGWYALVVALIDALPRDYGLTLYARHADGSDETLNATVTVTAAGYLSQRFNIPADRAYLTEPEVERKEFARIDALTTTTRPEKLWDSVGFQLPMDAEFTSGFGQYRVLNQNIRTRHTGWDQRAVPGTPVQAIGNGEVVFAGRMDIRGNYVLIDHGMGVYSGYAHFSQLNVERGQSVQAGQVIGLSGNTGRSSGPHLHWEVNINGEWVDSVAFVEMWLP